jgi:hypothetical protein
MGTTNLNPQEQALQAEEKRLTADKKRREKALQNREIQILRRSGFGATDLFSSGVGETLG